MSFDSTIFLFIFLPVCLLVYFVADRRYRNGVALLASLVFFAWGQLFYLPLMLALIVANYALGRRMEAARGQPGPARGLLIGSIVLNLLPLVFFKLVSAYGTDWLSLFLSPQSLDALRQQALPLGLSYIVFQLISYQVDIYNELVDSEKRFLTFALYILFFPKIMVGQLLATATWQPSLKNASSPRRVWPPACGGLSWAWRRRLSLRIRWGAS